MRERQLAAAAIDNNMPTVGDEMCPSMRFDIKMPHARESMKKMLAKMEEQFPNIFVTINAAFQNISDETFFDKERFDI